MSLRAKQVVAILISTPIAIVAGIAASAVVADTDKMAIAAGIGVAVLAVIQIFVGLHKTSDEQLLDIMKNADLEERRRDAIEAAAIDSRILQEIEAGNLSAVRDWVEYRRERPRR